MSDVFTNKEVVELLSLWVGVAASIISTTAIIVGGFWAYRKFVARAEHEQSLAVELICTAIGQEERFPVLYEIRVRLLNKGKVPCTAVLEDSRVIVGKIGPSDDDDPSDYSMVEYAECDDIPERKCMVVPVGSWSEIVDSVFVFEPGYFRVDAEIAADFKTARRFHRRVGGYSGSSRPSDGPVFSGTQLFYVSGYSK